MLYRETRKRTWPIEKLNRERASAQASANPRGGRTDHCRIRPAAVPHPFRSRPAAHSPANLRTSRAILLSTSGTTPGIMPSSPTTPPMKLASRFRPPRSRSREITGRVPQVIAYPNGNVSSKIEAARDAGLWPGYDGPSGQKCEFLQIVSATSQTCDWAVHTLGETAISRHNAGSRGPRSPCNPR